MKRYWNELRSLIKNVMLATSGSIITLSLMGLGVALNSSSAHIEAFTPIHAYVSSVLAVAAFLWATARPGFDTHFAWFLGTALGSSSLTAIAAHRIGRNTIFNVEIYTVIALLIYIFIFPILYKNELEHRNEIEERVRNWVYSFALFIALTIVIPCIFFMFT